MKNNFLFILVLAGFSCRPPENDGDSKLDRNIFSGFHETSLVILGTVQDGGSPHIGCTRNCCKDLFGHPEKRRSVVSLGIIDPQNKKKYMFECTPDFPIQSKKLSDYASFDSTEMPDGIFLTHAHIGHYSGLMYLGKEAIDASSIPVYVMPRMKKFIESNGPWSQLVHNNNILVHPLVHNQKIKLTSNISVTPITVPHRDEYSETVGFIIEGSSKKILFIPDIDKWEKWNEDIINVIANVDFAFIDGTFYDGAELNNRDMAEIPHPFIIESMKLFGDLSASEKSKIYFTHFNHTNPALDSTSNEFKLILQNGFRIVHKDLLIKL